MADHTVSQEAEFPKSETNVNVESQKEIRADGEDMAHNPDIPDYNAQYGVKSAEAITLSWTKSSLIIVYMR